MNRQDIASLTFKITGIYVLVQAVPMIRELGYLVSYLTGG